MSSFNILRKILWKVPIRFSEFEILKREEIAVFSLASILCKKSSILSQSVLVSVGVVSCLFSAVASSSEILMSLSFISFAALLVKVTAKTL
jgi:hypothetical protein